MRLLYRIVPPSHAAEISSLIKYFIPSYRILGSMIIDLFVLSGGLHQEFAPLHTSFLTYSLFSLTSFTHFFTCFVTFFLSIRKEEDPSLGEAKEFEDQYMQLFGCNTGSFPIRYLGIPIHYRRLSNSDWLRVQERLEKRLSSRKGKNLSTGGRLTLINSVLSSLPMYMMSFFEIPKGVRKKLDYFRSRFFWQSDEHKRKYRLAKWDILCQPKEQEGLGIQNLELKNIALLSKWLYHLLTTDGTWQQILRNKYLGTKPLVQVHWKSGDSHFWGSLMKVKNEFLKFGTFTMGLKKKQDTVGEVLSTPQPNLSWRRDLIENNLAIWNNQATRLAAINLSQEEDEFKWDLDPAGVFSVKTHYRALINQNVPNVNKKLWKLKTPLKIKICLWYLRRGFPTREEGPPH
ncbi:Unknown protein [Striga hermonthica]|uniref:Reverse transcriptase zinc-binding domain-containing protein n=1 Tax=Striga hermonthica TaxID=68872 RepID=A0A9N7MKK5_STRHE|nr:Unknown protein [Striga hermonthica]